MINKNANNFNRRHSCLISISKLEPTKDQSITQMKEQIKQKIMQDQGNKRKSHRKGSKHHKGSVDSAHTSENGRNGAPSTNSKLRIKAEEVKARGLANPRMNTMTDQSKAFQSESEVPSKYNNYENQSRIMPFKKNYVSHKDSKESGGLGTEQLGESVVPPQVIDNSAVLFDNRNKKFKRK